MKDQGYLTGEEDVSDTMIMYLRRWQHAHTKIDSEVDCFSVAPS